MGPWTAMLWIVNRQKKPVGFVSLPHKPGAQGTQSDCCPILSSNNQLHPQARAQRCSGRPNWSLGNSLRSPRLSHYSCWSGVWGPDSCTAAATLKFSVAQESMAVGAKSSMTTRGSCGAILRVGVQGPPSWESHSWLLGK